MAKAKKKSNVFRFIYPETGEHYTIRLSREAFDKLNDKKIMKYSSRLKKHVEFKITKKVK